MSWQQARTQAAEWLDKLQLRKEQVRGKVIDLRPHAHLITHEGQFQTMIYRAAQRHLIARGAAAVIIPDIPRRKLLE